MKNLYIIIIIYLKKTIKPQITKIIIYIHIKGLYRWITMNYNSQYLIYI